MRLGQLARKYNLSQQKIIAFLDEHNPGMGPYSQNTKLSDQTEDLIASHFNKSFADAAFAEESLAEAKDESKTADQEDPEVYGVEHEDLAEERNEEAEIQASLDPTLPVPEAKEPATQEAPGKAISTDKLIEILDSEEEDVDLSEITLIKAPKKELEGLKVVGKIDLPEPKPKAEKKPAEDDVSTSDHREPRRKRRSISPEEKEKRRLRAKKKKEAYEAKQERRRQEAAARREKERKKAHYEKKLKQAKSTAKKSKTTKPQKEEVVVVRKQRPKPNTRIGRFWAWFWRGEKFEE